MKPHTSIEWSVELKKILSGPSGMGDVIYLEKINKLFSSTLAEARKERDDTAYAKGIIKGKEQAVKEIEGIIGKDDLPDIEHKHKYSLAWAPVRNIFRKELRKALSDILSVLKGGL
jgi:hypothetical protein